MSRITVKDLNNDSFYKIPKGFLHNPKYISMKSESKLAYSLLKDLLDLSAKNGWVNASGEIYVKISREKLMLRLNIRGTQKMTQVMNELKELQLIEETQVGLKKCNEIYICHVEDLGVIYNDADILLFKEEEKNKKARVLKIKSQENKTSDFRKSKVQSFENQKSRVLKIKDISILSNTKTKYLPSSSSKENELSKYFQENICELKKTTSIKFKKFIKTKDSDFVKALIDYQSEIGTKSYAGFSKAIENFSRLNTPKELYNAIQSFRESKKTSSKNKGTSKKAIKNFEETKDGFLQDAKKAIELDCNYKL